LKVKRIKEIKSRNYPLQGNKRESEREMFSQILDLQVDCLP
jgi:hypothetical protein